MCKVYQRGPLPSSKLFDGDWVLQEDNDPKHTSKLAKKWREEHGVTRIIWPAQSPDQNCIENVWRILKANVQANKPKSVPHLKKIIKQEWKALPAKLAATLVNSMERRIQALLEAKGDYTMY